MPKAKKSGKRKTFNYNQDRKKLKKKVLKKNKPRIENSQIRHAWDDRKSMAKNLQEMGLTFDPNRSLPITKQQVSTQSVTGHLRSILVCVSMVVAELEEEASRPEKDTKTLSSDLIEYAQYMIREHKDNFKVRAFPQ
uniref:Nucleolar protein 16 n=1 Tax=Sphaeramia orbicularis TaxID=375764 RepID=A0A673C627_9TELE